jgi:hypothetical protein
VAFQFNGLLVVLMAMRAMAGITPEITVRPSEFNGHTDRNDRYVWICQSLPARNHADLSVWSATIKRE